MGNAGSIRYYLSIFCCIYFHIFLFPAVLSFNFFFFLKKCFAFNIFKGILFEDLDRKLTVINKCSMHVRQCHLSLKAWLSTQRI